MIILTFHFPAFLDGTVHSELRKTPSICLVSLSSWQYLGYKSVFEDTPHALTKRTNKQTNNEINEEGLKKVTTLTVWAIITKSPITFKRGAALVKT